MEKVIEVAIKIPNTTPVDSQPKRVVDNSEKLKNKMIVDDSVDQGNSDGFIQIAASASKAAGASRKLSWGDQEEKEASNPKSSAAKNPPVKSYAEAVGNRDVQNGWKLTSSLR